MNSILKLALLCILALWTSAVSASPSGAPERACQTLTPSHGVAAQTSEPPYVVTLSDTTVEQGGTVKVKIQSSDKNSTFRGFLAVARSADDSSDVTPFGTFTTEEISLAKIQACLDIPSSSATHVSRDDKDEVHLEWIAPPLDGNYQILVTVVQEKTIFWVAIPSEVITVTSDDATDGY